MPKFSSLDELVRFFDTYGLGEYWDRMPKACFDILDNPRLSGFASFPIGTPGDFLTWFRARWGETRV